tara:strand:- start:1458 stop:1685 length:228 start_codon:yes stop_codon:yes gene_type:complete
MKIMLVLFFCSKMAGTCLPPYSPDIMFDDKYSCLTYGYKLSYEIMTELGPEKVNKDLMYIKFDCVDYKNNKETPL